MRVDGLLSSGTWHHIVLQIGTKFLKVPGAFTFRVDAGSQFLWYICTYLPNYMVYEDCHLHTLTQFPILYDFTTYKCIFTWQLITNLIPSPKIAHVYMLKVILNDRHCHCFQLTQNCNTFSNTYEILIQCLWHVFLCVTKQTDLVSCQTAGVLPRSPCVWFFKTSHNHF